MFQYGSHPMLSTKAHAVLQLACGSPLMETMTTVPTLQEALADTSGLPLPINALFWC